MQAIGGRAICGEHERDAMCHTDGRLMARIIFPFAFALLLVSSVIFISCKTVQVKETHDAGGLMYGMIYDHNNVTVKDVELCVNGKIVGSSDIQGRFVLKAKKAGLHDIELRKAGYETIQQSFRFDSMNVLYFRMINASQLIVLAEEALDAGSHDKARQYLARAIALDPLRPDALFLSAVVCHGMGDYSGASRSIRELRRSGYQDGAMEMLTERLRQEGVVDEE
jgi:hypothetical protein